MLETIDQIRALPEVSAFQFGFVKAYAPEGARVPNVGEYFIEGSRMYRLTYEWHALLLGHQYQGAIACSRGRDPQDFVEMLAVAARESLKKGIPDAKRHSEPSQ